MSGGSFNYLYIRDDCSSILEHQNEMYDLKTYLKELAKENNFNVDDICDDLDNFIKKVTDINLSIPDEFKKFSGIFKSVEWKASGDSGIESVISAIEKYREDNYKICADPYVLCDGCNSKIYLGDEIIQFEGFCGIYCSDKCFAESHGKFNILTEEEAENCGHAIYTDKEDLLKQKEKLQSEINRLKTELNNLNSELSKCIKAIEK